MNFGENYCVSVFKNGALNVEDYTSVWIDLINRSIKDGSLPLSCEEKRK